MLKDGSTREMLSEAVDIVKNTAGTMTGKADLLENFTQQIEESASGQATGWTAIRMTATDGSQVFVGSLGRAVIIGPNGQMAVGQLGQALTFTKEGITVLWNVAKLIV